MTHSWTLRTPWNRAGLVVVADDSVDLATLSSCGVRSQFSSDLVKPVSSFASSCFFVAEQCIVLSSLHSFEIAEHAHLAHGRQQQYVHDRPKHDVMFASALCSMGREIPTK